MAVIGKRFGDAGLRTLLIESRTVGPSAVIPVLAGKHYNRVIRAHTLAMEAFLRVQWRTCREWLNERDGALRQAVLNAVNVL